MHCQAYCPNRTQPLIDGGLWLYYNPDPDRPGIKTGIHLCHTCLLHYLDLNDEPLKWDRPPFRPLRKPAWGKYNGFPQRRPEPPPNVPLNGQALYIRAARDLRAYYHAFAPARGHTL